ncbi:Homeobox protein LUMINIDEPENDENS [Vitis vinifera]|uniref:Homeobox protein LUMINIDEPENDENS n=1 Tax=Vitis vinifera TaxID=29760 RepID=A0A438KH74_VITVI|nr:Homeobox protein LUMINIDEPENDENS [Vitis vinifera]
MHESCQFEKQKTGALSMEVLKENISEIDIGTSTASFKKFVDSQNELFNSQVDQLGSIVLKQCELTGVNPLSQEMAAGALSIKIGKRPRDLLNPKAVKYMQAVFSIKDAISKKESREISALFGVTVTQVREFFAGQRSRVRKVVRLSREKSVRSDVCKELQDGVLIPSDPMIPIDQAPLNSIGPSSAEEVPSCSTQAEALPGLDDSERYFLENIFTLMRKEETFSGQVELMEWILQMQNSSVLNWFLSKGGMMILATWLSQAANEEQTSVLLVLCHLPLHKALPVHMSAILHSVNRLRFYRTSDIEDDGMLFAGTVALVIETRAWVNKGLEYGEMLWNLRAFIGEIMGDESWKSEINIPGQALAPFCENSETVRCEIGASAALKLLPSSAEDTNRKSIRGVSSSRFKPGISYIPIPILYQLATETRERRKVQLVEQPGQKTAGRILQPGRAVPVSHGRPMSADDIQKAKMRAQFMQTKYGKIGSSSKDKHEANSEGPSSKSSSSQTSTLLSVSKAHGRPKIEENKKPVTLPPRASNKVEALPQPKLELMETLFEKCKKVQIPWQAPPEIRFNPAWRVGTGESSKEVEVQKNRIRREKETVYEALQDIPPNPKEPWDLEMDYDDSLTPVIPIEQPPDADSAAESPIPPEPVVGPALPDFELLSVLLKNPELVFALMNGQAGSLSSEDTVRLLDMIKANGVGSLGTLNGLGRKAEEKVEVSLPSPTPSSNPVPVPSGWRPEFAKNPFSRQGLTANSRDMYASSPGVDFTGPARQVSMANIDITGPPPQRQLPATNLVLPPQTPAVIPPPQQPANFPPLSQQPPPLAMLPSFSLPQTTSVLPEKRLPSTVPSLHQNPPPNSSVLQSTTPEIVLNMNNFPAGGIPLPRLLAAAAPSVRVETLSNHKPGSVVMNAPERGPISYSVPQMLPRPTRPLTQQQPSSMLPPEPPHPLHHTMPMGNLGPVPDSWRGRQGLASNPLNQNNYNLPVGGALQHPPLTAPSRERNEYVFEDDFETWSPEGSPSRTPEYMLGGHNPLEPRMSSGRTMGLSD